VRPGAEDDALLRHEQTHFDLTELAARRLRKHLAELRDPCIDTATPREIDRVIAEHGQQWEQEQKLYDRQTGHGTNAARQQFWDRQTREQLDALAL
jgi:predicted secreted Zn-dependent protease